MDLHIELDHKGDKENLLAIPTIYGLNKWQIDLYEKFGWMLLLKYKYINNYDIKFHEHYLNKLLCYVESCEMLAEKTKSRLHSSSDIDKTDLTSMYNNAMVLFSMAKEHFIFEKKDNTSKQLGGRRRKYKNYDAGKRVDESVTL